MSLDLEILQHFLLNTRVFLQVSVVRGSRRGYHSTCPIQGHRSSLFAKFIPPKGRKKEKDLPEPPVLQSSPSHSKPETSSTKDKNGEEKERSPTPNPSNSSTMRKGKQPEIPPEQTPSSPPDPPPVFSDELIRTENQQEGGSSRRENIHTAAGVAKLAFDLAGAVAEVFTPLKATLGAISVFYDQYEVNFYSSADSPPLIRQSAGNCCSQEPDQNIPVAH